MRRYDFTSNAQAISTGLRSISPLKQLSIRPCACWRNCAMRFACSEKCRAWVIIVRICWTGYKFWSVHSFVIVYRWEATPIQIIAVVHAHDLDAFFSARGLTSSAPRDQSVFQVGAACNCWVPWPRAGNLSKFDGHMRGHVFAPVTNMPTQAWSMAPANAPPKWKTLQSAHSLSLLCRTRCRRWRRAIPSPHGLHCHRRGLPGVGVVRVVGGTR